MALIHYLRCAKREVGQKGKPKDKDAEPTSSAQVL